MDLDMQVAGAVTGARGIGGSDIGRIMDGDWETLWAEKTGRQAPEDLTWVQPVQMGKALEPLLRTFYAHDTGFELIPPNDFGAYAQHIPELGRFLDQVFDHGLLGTSFCAGFPDWALMRPDSFVLDDAGVLGGLETKAVNGFWKPENFEASVYPQVQWYLFVSGLPWWDLYTFYGNAKRERKRFAPDTAYIGRLLTAAELFWNHVVTDTPPTDRMAEEVGKLKGAVSLDNMREVDLAAEPYANEIAVHLESWRLSRGPAKAFDQADKAIKKLLPADVKKATGFGVTITRSKSDALTIKENSNA